MNLGLINFSEIEGLLMQEVARKIYSSSKLPYGSLTISQLQISRDLPERKIFEDWEHEVFGYGVYVFFDGKFPVYVGKAKSNFKHRFQSHRHFDGRENYGFNELARFIAQAKFKRRALALNKNTFFNTIIPKMEKLEVIRINLLGSGYPQNKCQRLENLLNKCLNDSYPNKLYNGIASVHVYDLKKPLIELM